MSMDIFFNKRKIRYNDLNLLFKDKLSPSIKQISVYMELNSIMNELYRPDIFEGINVGREKLTISSQILNTVAHYRHYFYSRYGISTVFYLTYSNDKATYPISIQNDYKQQYYDRLFSDSPEYTILNRNVKRNMNIVKLFCEYLPDVYFIEGNDFEPSALPYYLITTDTDNNQLNLVITENNLSYQLLALDSTYILDLKKRDIITRNNVFQALLGKSKTSILSTELLTLYFAIVGKKTYNINNVRGFAKNKANKLIEQAINDKLIINKKYKDINEVTTLMLNNGLLKTQEQVDLINNNFKIMDYELLCQQLSTKHKHLIDDCFVDRLDHTTLKRINDTYFNNQPIMLMEITEGC